VVTSYHKYVCYKQQNVSLSSPDINPDMFKYLLAIDLYHGGPVTNANSFLVREERNIRSLYLQANNLEWLHTHTIHNGY
jgi:hypothetical protein